MKLYYFADGCSLATHIAMREAGMEFEIEEVDVQTRLTGSGRPFPEINDKGYVPALAGRLAGDYLLDDHFSVADAFLYVMLRWAKMSKMEVSDRFTPYVERIEARPAVQAALRAERLKAIGA